MPRTSRCALWAVLMVGVGSFLGSFAAHAADTASAKRLFADPPRQYSSAPLWVWNDMLTDDEIVGTMRDLAGQQVKQVFVHPRPGLMTPYLSQDWFRLWKLALKEAERLDMNVWIYDENSYPSGFAGGWVPELMPAARGRGLHFSEGKQPKLPREGLVGVYRLDDNGYRDVTDQVRQGTALPDAKYLVAAVQRAHDSPWHGGRSYVDLLYPGVTQKFLDVTLEAYRREIGDQFGKRVPGSFTDEPQLRPAGGLPWTDDLPAQFQRRWGYSLTQNLPSLTRPVGDWKKVRCNYYQLLMELMIERWAKPYYEYCQQHHLEFTGHYWDHEWPNCVAVPDNMAMYAWHQRPAIDCLMNEYQETTHAQFGNVRMVRELASVANQLGRPRTLCEIYGAGGWDLRFEDMKRIADWLGVLGVNTFDEHLSYVTIRGARKWDHPQSFSYHEPWWDSYHVVARYLTRLSMAMSQGRQVNHVLVIEPTSTAWLYQADATQAAKLKKLGDDFQSLVNRLDEAQVEYDIGCENIIAHDLKRRVSRTDGRTYLHVGQCKYDAVILPPGFENLDRLTELALQAYVGPGGIVYCCGAPPQLTCGSPTNHGAKLAELDAWKTVSPDTVTAQLADTQSRTARPDGFSIKRSESQPGKLFHQRRVLDDGQLLLLVNTSIDAPAAGEITASTVKHVECWNLETGATAAYPATLAGDGVTTEFSLPPCGSLLLLLSNQPGQPAAQQPAKVTPLRAAGPLTICRSEPNVLTLDYFDVSAGGETKAGLYCYKACQFAFQKNGLERNPWDSAVQFKDELISKEFPPESGCAATYRFTIEQAVPKPLWIVVERPDLYAITCNGQAVQAAPGQWWLDKAFGKIDLSAVAKVGENAVMITARPMTIYHELMPAYVLGEFALKPAARGFAIVPPEPLKLGAWNTQGLPLYGHRVAYRQSFDVSKPAGRYQVRLPKWYGSVAKVTVNGKPAGHIAWAPWTCDVTEQIVPGKNEIEVTVVGTLKNTLGPHHAGAVAGRAWPAMFHQGPETGPPPGEKYHTLGYGLFEPPVLEQSTF